MCGIAGYTHKGGVFPAGRMRSVVASLVHRGPDQQGIYESRDISLGAARLKIVDLESGCQPMLSEDESTVLVFNGEVYNHAELRTQLEGLGHRFFTRSDTEVVLHAFLEWDRQCLARLRGMFALAIWSGRQRRLLLARDRLGIKPLYFCRRGADLCFGSELKALFEHPQVERRLDLAGLNCYLALNYVPGPRTLVEGIEKLPPGHWLEWRDGEVRQEPFWQLAVSPRPSGSLDSACEELDDLMQSSLREHLIADVPLGMWISGGLDSSTILHYAATLSSSRLKTFSISFCGRSFDESAYFREIAARYGTEHYEFDLNPETDLVSAIEEFAWYSDEPGADSGALPVWFLSRLSRPHVTVALSGEGADELFGGYLTYQADRFARARRRIPRALWRLALGLSRHWPVSDDKISFEYQLKRFLEGALLPPDEAHLFWNGTFSESEQNAFFPAADRGPIRELLARMPPGQNGRLDRYLWFDQRYYLPDNILYKVDRMSMAHSVEVRPPFLDHRIVEFAASLPEQFKVRGLLQKVLLRELMKDKLPPSILRRKKVGFDIPAHDWFRTVLRPLLLDTLTEENARRIGLFRWEALEALVRAHLERRANLGFHLWGLLVLFLWMRRWNIQTADAAGESQAKWASAAAR